METYFVNLPEPNRRVKLLPNDSVQVVDLNDLVKERVLVSDLLTVMDDGACTVLNASRLSPKLNNGKVLLCTSDSIFLD